MKIEKVLFSKEAIDKRVREMGARITADFKKEGVTSIVVLGILKGSFMFMADLIRTLDLEIECEFLGVSSYGDATKSSGEVKVTHDLTKPIQGKHVLLIEDIADTGLTLQFLQKTLVARGAAQVRTAVFLAKPSQHKVTFEMHYVGFEIGNEFVIGYGLDAAGKFRNLPYVGVVKT